MFDMALADQDLSLGGPRIKPLENGESEVTFRFRAPKSASAVYLAGTFNEWKPDAHAMDGPDPDGFYSIRVTLKPGRHEYKFVIDGRHWRHDPANRAQAGFYRNSVIVVPSAPPEQNR
jgi:1,4-alpha-glucan branching enzyme